MIGDLVSTYMALSITGIFLAGLLIIWGLIIEEARGICILLVILSIPGAVYCNIQATELDKSFDYTQAFEYTPGARMEWGGDYSGVLYDKLMFEYNDKTIFIPIDTSVVTNIGWKNFEILKVEGDNITIRYTEEII